MTAPNPPRVAEVQRNTKETQIRARVNLDGTGLAQLATGIGFFDHMLDQVARHGLIDLEIDAKGARFGRPERSDGVEARKPEVIAREMTNSEWLELSPEPVPPVRSRAQKK